MASDTRMVETPLRWRRAQDVAQDAGGMESGGMILPRSTAAELGLSGYMEPSKLSYGTEKGCPWRGSQGCLGTSRELAGGRLGCPYPVASPCLRDTLCRPKDGAEFLPRNGQPKAGWAEPCKEHPKPRWAEAMLAPLALYSHHRYPLPFPGLDGQCPKPHAAAGDGDGDPPTFRHCPFLLDAKHSPFLLSSLLPAGPPGDPQFGSGGPEGAGAMGDGRFAGVDWHLGSYVPAWGHPVYLGLPSRCKMAPTTFDESSSSGNKEFYPKKEPGFPSPAEDQAPSQLLGKGQDGAGEREPELPGAPWRDGRVGGSSVAPAPHVRTPPPSSSHPLFLLQPGRSGGCGGPWLGAQPPGADFHLELGQRRPSQPKDECLAYQSSPPGDPDPSPPLADGHDLLSLAKPDPPPTCLCTTPGCNGCPGVGCRVLNLFEPPLGIPGGRFPCPPSNHTKLKKTWLTRHSEQSLPRCKGPRRDGGPEPPGEGKRSAKRPHGTGDGPGVAKRGTKASEHVATAGDDVESGGDPEERRMELGQGATSGCAGREPWCLQSVPCTALPENIPRCCTCATRAPRDPQGEEEEEEDPPESTCRLLHFRRFTLGDSGDLTVDGICTLGEAEGGTLQPEVANPDCGGSSLCLAKYLLGVLGDNFCQAVRRDRDVWPGAPEGVTGWRRGAGAPQLCDACQCGFFNSHWSCARCGFQLCPGCHRSRREADGHEGPAWPPQCIPGQEHHVASLVPTQFVPTCVLSRLWKLLHEVRIKFNIESHCPCGEGAAEQSLAEPPGSSQMHGVFQELPGAAVPTLPNSSDGQTDTSRPIKEESPERGSPPPGQPPPRVAVQPGTLCDLLASTAVKLCLGQDGVRMAFAPVSPALPNDNRLTSILDSIIARVVERKIQERQEGGELSPPSPKSSPCTLAPSGLLWLHDPGHTSNYQLFQEHWRRGQPVLVSGLQKRLERGLWGPESFRPVRGEQAVDVVNLRAPGSRLRVSSRQFWDGFATSAASLELDGGDLLKLESGFGDMELCRAANLRASLPLPEYCGATGRLNLATYLRGQRGRHWLRPRVCAAYGVHPRDRNIGTKNLTVEPTDTISILVHAAAGPPEALLREGDADGVDAQLQERLWDAGSRPGALWHIFRAEDAARIHDFLQKDQGQEGAGTAQPPSHYLDLSLRRRLQEECGVSGWTLLQFVGDAVLVPAGAPHQVQTLTSTISVEQRFLSPESAICLRDHSIHPFGAAHQLHAQLDGMIFCAVQEAVGVLQGCK